MRGYLESEENECRSVDQTKVVSIADHTGSIIPAGTRARALLALAKLIELRDHWNKLDGFKVDWNDTKATKWCITVDGRKVSSNIPAIRYFLYFGNRQTRNDFYGTYHTLIKEIKVLF